MDNKRHKVFFILMVIGVFLLLSVPYASHYAYNWDAGQFALGVKNYSLEQHQPHPPGYPVYIVLGKALNFFLDNVNASLLCVTLFIAALAVIFLFLLVLEIYPLNKSLAAAACWLFLGNPVFWFYREIALTYVVDAFAGIFLAWLFFKNKKNGKYFYFGALILGLLGGFRPTLIALLLPAFAVNIFYLGNKKIEKIFFAGLILLFGILLWFTPMVVVTGGLNEYWQITNNLLSASAEETSVLQSAPLAKTVEQIHTFISILGAAVNVLIVPLLFSLYVFFKKKKYRGLWKNKFFWFIFFWLIPASCVYMLVHFGQAGYVLLLLPIFLILALPGIKLLYAQNMGKALLAFLLVFSCGQFLLLNNEVSSPSTYQATNVWEKRINRVNPWFFKFNYAMIRNNDVKTEHFIHEIRKYNNAKTIVIAVRNLLYTHSSGLSERNDENFRQIMFYLPQYPVYEVAPSRDFFIKGENYTTKNIFKKRISMPDKIEKVIILSEQIDEANLPVDLPITRKTGYYEGSLKNINRFEFLGFEFVKQS